MSSGDFIKKTEDYFELINKKDLLCSHHQELIAFSRPLAPDKAQ